MDASIPEHTFRLAALVLRSPLLSSLLATAALAVGHSRMKAWRRKLLREEVKMLLAQGQFEPAPQEEVDALLALSRQSGCHDEVLLALAQIRRRHGYRIKLGHLYFIHLQVAGQVPFEVVAPACTRDDAIPLNLLPASLAGPE